uniref:Uncharacterized protein n=1 Tax=Coccidioides posadasii RMSCC 3488 TaxID=454284 RepID=A0A0J6I2M7_COCPO|nr:hypothetical protein CPAG_01932 [Coccidioides posadasii RMSCC 3488]
MRSVFRALTAISSYARIDLAGILRTADIALSLHPQEWEAWRTHDDPNRVLDMEHGLILSLWAPDKNRSGSGGVQQGRVVGRNRGQRRPEAPPHCVSSPFQSESALRGMSSSIG